MLQETVWALSNIQRPLRQVKISIISKLAYHLKLVLKELVLKKLVLLKVSIM